MVTYIQLSDRERGVSNRMANMMPTDSRLPEMAVFVGGAGLPRRYNGPLTTGSSRTQPLHTPSSDKDRKKTNTQNSGNNVILSLGCVEIMCCVASRQRTRRPRSLPSPSNHPGVITKLASMQRGFASPVVETGDNRHRTRTQRTFLRLIFYSSRSRCGLFLYTAFFIIGLGSSWDSTGLRLNRELFLFPRSGVFFVQKSSRRRNFTMQKRGEGS